MQYLTIQREKQVLAKAEEIKAFLENNYQDNHDYTFLAKKFGMNSNSLSIAFRILTNSSIHEYLTKVRIERAKKLLTTTDLHVTYIAARVGLDKTNLNIHFKRHTGMTPLQWRKNEILHQQTN
ncbi:hypothetical protein A3860_31520 [Niastella vici]|uniref:HTH araC/xylS-type domain-containing protein n=1 Tax=Niastella vici TaxID=1703345 RepID=A0A1V9FTY8_9BACT|nr:AraC family transcriptional regulator [Niastella vici]OQP61791.1 hypothetical protein A3860_31520 [Niastella vici]